MEQRTSRAKGTAPRRKSTSGKGARRSSVGARKSKRTSLEPLETRPSEEEPRPPVESEPEDPADAKATEPETETGTEPWALGHSQRGDSEELRLAYWASREGRGHWSVPMVRDLSQMPFLGESETGLEAAIAHAHKLGRTPLLIDSSGRGTVDGHFAPRGEVLDAKRMWQDEKTGARTHAQVMKDARKALVSAMARGRPFVVSLTNAAPDFVTRYSADDSLPLSLFDRSVVEALADFTGEGSLDLWESGLHPFAKLLRPNDLELSGQFHVSEGFQVIVTSQLDVASYASRLALSVPLLKMQAIAPVPW